MVEDIRSRENILAPYATQWQTSRGRFIEETGASDRSPFQRDRDRIIHSDAFRRLQYKMQVFMNTEQGDFRTRLTHTLEVAQLTRSICRALKLDEDLGEAVALAHDLGHPPFGHAGEDALNKVMQPFGGFRHNEQTLHILRTLECRYGNFDGLNLSWETLEGIAKHNGPIPAHENPDAEVWVDLEPTTHSGLEAQVAAICDDIAYNHHDLDDGLTSGNLHLNDVMSLPQFHRVWEEVEAVYPMIEQKRKVKETIRRMINRQVKDVLTTSHINLQKAAPKSAEEARAHNQPLVVFSPQVATETKQMKKFMLEKMYRHYKVNRMTFRAHNVVTQLFDAFFNHRLMLPEDWRSKLPADKNDARAKAQVICDYIACMTDRRALHEYGQLYGTPALVL